MRIVCIAFIILAFTCISCLGSEYDEIQSLYKISKLLKGGLNNLDLHDLYEGPNTSNTLSREDYDKLRQKMIEKDRSTHFTHDVDNLSEAELAVEKQLFAYRNELVYDDHTPLLLPFHEGKKQIQDGKLHNFFKEMPKGGHMHVHIEASVSMATFMNFTNEDFVYYNMDKNELRTAPKGLNEPGFVKCNDLRTSWALNGTFDEYLVNKLLLQPDEIASRESHKIWEGFQFKFMLNDAVIHYYKFYREALMAYYKQAVSEGVSIVEIRHASGLIFDDDHNFLDFKEEFELYKSVIEDIRKENQDFELRIIVVGFKVLGKDFVRKQLKSYQFAMDNGYDFVTGFDLVNEEDTTEPIHDFVDEMLDAKRNHKDFNFYFHAGESASRYNENLYDAILLGTKRIGHGVGIALHPHLMQLVTERKIGYEI